jgi:hypothetical protein
MNCPNCGSKLSCGCQRKTASDGKQGCTQCIPAYEKSISIKNSHQKDDQQLTVEQRIRLQTPSSINVTLS